MKLTLLRATVTAWALVIGLTPALGLAGSTLAADGGHSAAAGTSTGYDISWPQCGSAYPASPAFGIVGVNAGIVFSANPCLASQIAWAGGASAGLYANTGNPGPGLSKHWPTGQSTPRFCDPAGPDSADCAYDYGFNAAADSYNDAVAAFAALGLPGSPSGNAWWLDVETSNSWRSDVLLNVAALSGAVDYLRSVGVAGVGIYSTQYQWNIITGGTAAFDSSKSWVAGASDAQDATAKCAGSGFTGGGVALVQYISGGFDVDVRCPDAAPVLTTVSVSPASTTVQTGGTQQFTARADDQFGRPMSPQPAFDWSASSGSITSSGLFTAGSTPGGPITIAASSGGVSGTASVTVTGPAADFSIAAGPASRSVRRAASTTYALGISPRNGFAGSVTWSLAGQPAGSTVTFSPNPATTNATLAIRVPSSARGTYTLTITARSGSLVHSATVSLKVTR